MPTWSVDKEKAFKLALWCRDIRGGAGNRSGSRAILKWIANVDSEWIRLNLKLVPEYGRWDDLLALLNTDVEKDALELWANAIRNKDGLACKWAPRENKANRAAAKKLRKVLEMNPKDYRKFLAKNTSVVETAMCNRKWNEIEYSHVPSIAIGRYNKSFAKHDEVRYGEWKTKLTKGEVTVNTGAIYPHDCFRTYKSETGYSWMGGSHWGRSQNAESELANAQFRDMPDYFETGMRVMPIIDISGSMGCHVSGSIQAIDVAVGLGLYASDRVGKDNPFYRKLIPFSSGAKFFNWKGKTFSGGINALGNEKVHCGSTNVAAALNLIVETADMFNVTNEQIPNCLLIISDMQFDQGCNANETSVNNALRKWDVAGYDRPTIVYWNTAGYMGSPATAYDPNVGLVSGFSPSVLDAVFGGEDFSPMGILNRAIEKYEITVPA
jgi:hypothetical protein